jgi:hypothetical protein
MSTLKKVGRRARRLSAKVDKMEPSKLYTITINGKSMTRTGATWKAIKQQATR